MRHTSLCKLAVIGVLLVAPMFAQTSAYVRVNIPFAFHVGTRTLSPGEYVLKADGAHPQLWLWNKDNGQITLTVTNADPEATLPNTSATEIRFRKYGNTRFLTGIYIPGSSNIALLPSPMERELASEYRPGEISLAAVRQR